MKGSQGCLYLTPQCALAGLQPAAPLVPVQAHQTTLPCSLSLSCLLKHQIECHISRLRNCGNQSHSHQTSVKAHLMNHCSHGPSIRGIIHVQAALHDAPQWRHNMVFCRLWWDVQTENGTLPGFSGTHLHQQTAQSLDVCSVCRSNIVMCIFGRTAMIWQSAAVIM